MNKFLNYHNRVCNAINFINNNLLDPIRLENVAKAAALSKYHFHRIFKNSIGESISEYTRRLRLELAANRLLLDEKEKICNIAYDLGYSSCQNFSKAFKKHFGVSPNTFKKNSNQHLNLKEFKITESESNLPLRDDNALSEVIYDIRTEWLPTFEIIYSRKIGNYGKFECSKLFLDTYSLIQNCIGIKNDILIGLFWDNPIITPQGKRRFDAGFYIKEKEFLSRYSLPIQQLLSSNYLIISIQNASVSLDNFWKTLIKIALANGYIFNNKPVIVKHYFNINNKSKLIHKTEVCFPLCFQ